MHQRSIDLVLIVFNCPYYHNVQSCTVLSIMLLHLSIVLSQHTNAYLVTRLYCPAVTKFDCH